MSKTYCEAQMKFIDVTALADSSIYTEYNQDFADTSLFKEEEVTSDSGYATFELNHFFLDGSRTLMPEVVANVAFWSNTLSGSDCYYATNPTIKVNFTENHTSSGLTLYFGADYPEEIIVRWYDLDGTKLTQKTFYPTALRYVCRQQVTNYGSIQIEFVKTRLPKHYVKLQYILYGRHILWADDLIKSATVTESIDVNSSEVAINTASISIIDENDDFNIASPDGDWKSVQKNQPITLSEYVDGNSIDIGKYYINTFSFASNIAKFELIDSVGLLDQFTFNSGDIYANTKVSTLLTSIFDGTDITYELEEGLGDIELSGYLAIMSCREALQQVAFAIGAAVDDSRSDVIKIYKPSRSITSVIDTDRKFNGKTSVTLEEYVSGISVEYSKYAKATESQEIYNDTLTAGTTTIEFSSPFDASTISASAGTITNVTTNYLIITLTEDSECVITGIPYEETKFTVKQLAEKLDAGETENVKEFTGCTLYNAEVAAEVISDMYDYYQLRKKLSVTFVCNGEGVGNWVNVKDTAYRSNASLIEKQTTDLTGGYLATSTCRGYNVITTEYEYAGDGLYGEDDRLI